MAWEDLFSIQRDLFFTIGNICSFIFQLLFNLKSSLQLCLKRKKIHTCCIKINMPLASYHSFKTQYCLKETNKHQHISNREFNTRLMSYIWDFTPSQSLLSGSQHHFRRDLSHKLLPAGPLRKVLLLYQRPKFWRFISPTNSSKFKMKSWLYELIVSSLLVTFRQSGKALWSPSHPLTVTNYVAECYWSDFTTMQRLASTNPYPITVALTLLSTILLFSWLTHFLLPNQTNALG